MSTPAYGTDSPPDPFASLPQIPALDNTYGAGLIGTSVGFMLFGLTVHQVYRYFRLYPTDPAYMKIYVAALLMVETFHIILSLHTCYFYLITKYLQPGAFLIPVWSINTVPFATGVVAVLSQAFFVHRVWLIGPRFRPFVAITILLLCLELAATIETYVRPVFTNYWKVTWVFSASFGIAMVVDTILTGVLITVLHRSRTGIKRTDSMIDLLIVYSINTGLLTGVFNMLTFIFALVFPDNIIYGAFAVVTAKLYANSVLAALNTRRSLNNTGGGLELDSLGISFAQVGTTTHRESTTAQMRTNLQVAENGPTIVDIKAASMDTSLTGVCDDMEDTPDAKGSRFVLQTV
ncbi:uncharacterized protein TRAVEDRAFT_48880 [Trametes versicolor FP-101664 SS1]|uniref:uncharacterized protein n=1 Tax=Trametes versicolor (strain FP-101664) TaxID=717944 RepID=UPI0004622C63|nr:uncharacterized protein TRAVEDRAFT_48880 [Trametes versicolor FP-101664 SS1]EIW57853.1 hypothetical protein TRAVEDRAFT_48880 [Trametes versicolor FP-101664 SS1]